MASGHQDEATPRRVRVVEAYERSDPDPVVVAAGETLRVGRRDETYPAWVEVTTASGKRGWMPERDLDRRGESATALRDYDAAELTVTPGELLTVVEEAGGWLLTITAGGVRGWVPADRTARS